MAEQVRVFVSHHHSPEEDAFTDRLVTALEAAGADVWVDTAGITSDDFVKKISEGLADRQWLVVVATPASLASPWVQREVNVALNEHTAGRMLGVVPLVIQPCQEQDFPMLWRTLQRYDAATDYQAALAQLLTALGLPAAALPPQGSTGIVSHQSSTTTPAIHTRVVDASGRGDHRTITEALTVAEPGDRIVVRPGIYSGQIVIEKALDLIGDGDRDVIVIELSEGWLRSVFHSFSSTGGGDYAPVVLIRATGIRFSNVSVRGRRPRNGRCGNAIVVERGGELRLDKCDITSSRSGLSGIWVKSGKVTALHDHIHDCGFSGVVLEDTQGRAVLEDNTIDNCGVIGGIGPVSPALHIKRGAVVTAKGNHVTNNVGFGVRIEAGGKGVFEDNDLRGNQKGAWSIDESNMSNVQRSNNLE